MIDNRLAEDIQLKLRPEHFYEPLHGRIYEQILRLPRPQHDRQPDHAAAPVRGGRGDEGARRPGLSRPAHRLRRGDHRRARLRRADLRSRLAPRPGRRRPRDGRDRARHVARRSIPRARSSRPRRRSTGSPRRATPRAAVKSFAKAAAEAVRMAEKALNTGGGLSGITTGLETLNAKTGGLHHSDLVIIAGRPGMGKTALATNIAFNAARRMVQDIEDGIAAGSIGRRRSRLLQPRNVGRPARHPHPRRAIRDQLRSAAHGQDQPARFPQPRPRRRRARDAAALHRRHARPHHRGAAHPRPAAEAAEGDRADRRRLSPAAPGHGTQRPTTIASRRFRKSRAG